MSARPRPPKGCCSGNFVAEWFGHRVWPTVATSVQARSDQSTRTCPFLSITTGEKTTCKKVANGWKEPYGVCTISSDSNGVRQDWITCPDRTLDQHFALLTTAVRGAYGLASGTDVVVLPVTALSHSAYRRRIVEAMHHRGRVFLFSSRGLGGEIDLPETEASPGAAVDMSVMEVLSLNSQACPADFGKHLFYEIQTSDFHGSPLHAATVLKDLCPKCRTACDDYHSRLAEQVEVCGIGLEGPNKANIFKRTIYQMIFKIELATHEESAGFVIVLPEPVWDSWVRHLGSPKLTRVSEGGEATAQDVPEAWALLAPDEKVDRRGKASIYVFDIDRSSDESPQPLRILRQVLCSSKSLEHHAFTVAAREAVARDVMVRFRDSFISRVSQFWHKKPSRRRRG